MKKVSPQKLQRILQQIFNAQAREIASRIDPNTDSIPDLTPWVKVVVDATKPTMTEIYQQGMIRNGANRANALHMPPGIRIDVDQGLRRHTPGNVAIFTRQQVGTTKRFIGAIIKAGNKVGPSFDLFNPKVLGAVDNHTFVFARSTLDTATSDLKKAIAKLKELMRKGMEAGEATSLLAKKIRQIFADPNRAYTIAQTETSRFSHLGAIDAAKEGGATKKTWVTDYNGCEQCQSLNNKTVGIDEPFLILNNGPYGRVLCPPLHPSCNCDMQQF